MSLPKLRTALLTTLILTAAVAGCSSDEGEARPEEDPTTTVAERPEVVTGGVEDIPALADAAGIRKDVEVERCDTEPGEVSAEGTVTNTSDEATDVVIAVSWVLDEGNGVLAADTTIVRDLGPGERQAWELSGDIKAEADVACTVNARRGNLD